MSISNTAAAAGFQDAEGLRKSHGTVEPPTRPLLIRFGGLSDGDRVLDIGCGTGSLTFTLPEIANIAGVTGIDLTEPYLDFARARNADRRISFQQADARVLPFEDNSFDRAFSMLVLQFIPDATRAVAEMRRVVRPGGTVTAAVWDAYGGMPHTRMMWDTAAALDPYIEPPLFRPLSQPNEMATLWGELGLLDVEQTSLLIRMEFSRFEDYWLPLTSEGPVAQFVSGLSSSARTTLTDHVRRAYRANLPDGPRSFACVAWACRGTVPS